MGFPSDWVGWAPGGWCPSGCGRIGTKGVAPNWMQKDRHQGGGAQVDAEGSAPRGWRPSVCGRIGTKGVAPKWMFCDLFVLYFLSWFESKLIKVSSLLG